MTEKQWNPRTNTEARYTASNTVASARKLINQPRTWSEWLNGEIGS